MAIKIFIDQGHNPSGVNSGAEGNGYREQDLVYEIGVLLAAELTSEGFETRLSRPSPSTALGTSNTGSLAARVSAANAWGADYFISLHANASVNSAASGTEAFVYGSDGRSRRLAEAIVGGISAETGLADRGVFARPTLYVLRKTAMPAVLVELGFITNERDADLMANSPQLFADGINNGIIDYFAE